MFIIGGSEVTENESAIETLEFYKEERTFNSEDEAALDYAIKAIKEIEQYRAIGTVEECREAREKQKPKKPNIWGDGYDDSGNMIYDMYNCPNCGKSYEVDYLDYKFCPECGQAIDRSDLDKLV